MDKNAGVSVALCNKTKPSFDIKPLACAGNLVFVGHVIDGVTAVLDSSRQCCIYTCSNLIIIKARSVCYSEYRAAHMSGSGGQDLRALLERKQIQNRASKTTAKNGKPKKAKKKRKASLAGDAPHPTPLDASKVDTPTASDMMENEPTLVIDSASYAGNHLLSKYSDIQQKQQQFLQISKQLEGATMGDNSTLVERIESHDSLMPITEISDAAVMQSMQRMANMLMQAPHDTVTLESEADTLLLRSKTVIVRRQWEEKFLHEASGCERACCNRATQSCFASLIENHGILDPNFSLCEFYTEKEYTDIEKSGWRWPEQLRPCLLCLRNAIFHQLMQVRCNNTEVLRSVNYAPIGNLTGVRGEYCTENCFLSRPQRYEGLLVPVVIPNVLDYMVVTQNGVRYLEQLLPYPGGFKADFFF